MDGEILDVITALVTMPQNYGRLYSQNRIKGQAARAYARTGCRVARMSYHFHIASRNDFCRTTGLMFAIAEYKSMRQPIIAAIRAQIGGIDNKEHHLIKICIVALADCRAYFSHCPDTNDTLKGKVRLIDSRYTIRKSRLSIKVLSDRYFSLERTRLLAFWSNSVVNKVIGPFPE